MLTYEKSGVSIERGDEVVSRIKKIVPEIGDFGGFFPLELSGCKKPLLVAGADGVGTKIRIALDADLVDTIGIDLVAMNVNDVLCSGAKPLFFLDYIAAGKIDPNKIHLTIMRESLIPSIEIFLSSWVFQVVEERDFLASLKK